VGEYPFVGTGPGWVRASVVTGEGLLRGWFNSDSSVFITAEDMPEELKP
jgi:hypothetical protein